MMLNLDARRERSVLTQQWRVQTAPFPNNRIPLASGLATSNSDARRKIAGGGVIINGQRIDDPKKVQFFYSDVDPELGVFLVRYGNKIVQVRPV